MKEIFHKISSRVSAAAGAPSSFAMACLVIAIWALTGKFFDFSDTWQLVINTGTTIVTFLMVFLIQNTQNRDNKALQLKLDELIRASSARDSFVAIENLSDDELVALDKEFEAMHRAQVSSDTMKKLHDNIKEVKESRTLPRKAAAYAAGIIDRLS
jgi:low affinity Fe/Cu permease